MKMKVIISLGLLLIFFVGSLTNSETQKNIKYQKETLIKFPKVKYDSASMFSEIKQLSENIKVLSKTIRIVKKQRRDSLRLSNYAVTGKNKL